MTQPIQTGFAPLNGVDFYYEICGQGQPLVLLHSGICDCRMWDEQLQFLAQHYQVIRYDRRGFGKTRLVAGDYYNYEDLRDLLDYLHISQAILVGSSQGGKISLHFALHHPERVKALVLVASALDGFNFEGPPPSQRAEAEVAYEAGDMVRVNELELQIWVDGPHRNPDEVNPQVRELVREMNLIALSAPTDLGQELEPEPATITRLGELYVPTLVIVGALDVIRMLATANFLAQNISGAQQVVIPQAAHFPNMEQPEIFNQHVTTFLNAAL